MRRCVLGHRSGGAGGRGITLIETLFAIAILSIVFWGLFGAFRLSLEVVSNIKAKTGALALATEHVEYIRSLAYDSVGTAGGIPAGGIAQTELVTLNQVPYTRRTLVQYVDSPDDGLGGADINGITADYKVAKVEVSWDARGSARSLFLVTNVVPQGIESIVGGGTLTITVLDAYAAPLSSASVRVQNDALDPAVDVTAFTNASGVVMFPGAPSSDSYRITVTREEYSTAQTYDVTAQNPNPSPRHLSVLEGQTTSATFAIDRLSSETVYTYEPIETKSLDDPFDDFTYIISSASTTVGAGLLELQGGAGAYEPEGYVVSNSVTDNYLFAWDEFSFVDVKPAGTTIRYRIYYESVPGTFAPVPDSDIPGNAAGFTVSPVDLSGLSTSTYGTLRARGDLLTSDPMQTPRLDEWHLSYEVGPVPVPNVPFALRGTKTIGSDADANPIYKYDQSLSTDSTGSRLIPSLEWDTYQISVSAASGWDVAESCPPQPFSLAPGVASSTVLYLTPDAGPTLLVVVMDNQGTPLEDATVTLSRELFDATLQTSKCGSAFFNQGIPFQASDYTVYVSAVGYQATTINNVSVADGARLTIVLNQ